MSSPHSTSSSVGELLTLSIGAAANDITAFYFNAQWAEVEDSVTAIDSKHSTFPSFPPAVASPIAPCVDWRVLFRSLSPPSTSSSPLFIPRLVAVSLASQTGYYPGIGDVIDYSQLLSSSSSSSPSSHWDGRVTLSADPDDLSSLSLRQRQHAERNIQPSIPSSSPQCWTDLLTLPSLHPKNIFTLPPLMTETDTFDYFTQGQEMIKQGGAMEAIMDRVRWFIEEADHIQGMQVIAEATNAWGGVAECVVKELRDEFERSPILFMGLHSSYGKEETGGDVLSLSQLNSLLCLSRLTEEVDVYLPLYTPSSMQQTSPSVMKQRVALTWQQISLPYCRPQAEMDLRHMTSLLVPSRANIIGCSVTWDISASLLCHLAHPHSPYSSLPQSNAPVTRQMEQRRRDIDTESSEDKPSQPLHSLPSIMHQMQPFHSSLYSSTSSSSFPARQQRRKGAIAREEDGDGEESFTPPPPPSHVTLTSHLILRGFSSSSSSHLLSDIKALCPTPHPQVTVVEGGESCVCDVYTCDAIGGWLRDQSELVGSVRRDGSRSFERMQREGGMDEDAWIECKRILRDKAESYTQYNSRW